MRLRIALVSALLVTGLAAHEARAQISDGVVKIGVLNDQTGLYADLGGPGSVEAARMAVEDFGGTVLGKPIEIVIGDHQNKADIALSIARRWYDVDKVDVIMDVLGSAVALAVQNLTRQQNKILLITGAVSDGMTNEACT